MTLKTTKEQRDEWLNSAKSYTDIPLNCIAALPFEFINNLCHDADEAERLETEVIRLSGLLANRDADTVYLRKEIADLRAKLNEALRRMDRTREILTGGTPTPDRNWGALDTSDLRALKEQDKP